jgi:hypothetical protein
MWRGKFDPSIDFSSDAARHEAHKRYLQMGRTLL